MDHATIYISRVLLLGGCQYAKVRAVLKPVADLCT